MRHPRDRHGDREEFSLPSEAHGLLWLCGMRATKPRLKLAEVLLEEKKPLSAAELHKKVGATGDLATTYRALEKLALTGHIVKIKNPNSPEAHYELVHGRDHHHHAICTSCGCMEDVEDCDAQELNAAVKSHLKKFKSIQSHSLEFFGLCKACEPKSR